jgi:glycosyltransferase involved in cell wall biosynthesis
MIKKGVRFYIENLGDDYLPAVQQGFDWVGAPSFLKSGDKVCIKPNLTLPTFSEGVMTNLAARVEWAWAHPEEMAAMGRAARAEYEAKYTAERNYPMLMKIYEQAITNHKAA